MAKCTVRFINKSSQMCIQADRDNLLVLGHIIKNISERQGQIIGSPGHVTANFLKFCISKKSFFQDQKFFSKNRPKIIKKNSRGCALHPSLRGCTPPIPQGWILVACLHLYLMTLTLHLAASHLTPQRVGCIMEYSLAACVGDCRQQQYGANYITIPDYKSG